MSPELIILLSVLGALLLFIGILVVRALMFKPRAVSDTRAESVFVNKERAVETLAELIRQDEQQAIGSKNIAEWQKEC